MTGAAGCRKKTKTRKKVQAQILIVAVCVALLALQARLRAEPDRHALEKNIWHILSTPLLKGASVGIHVVSIPDGKTLFSLNADSPFVVASNMKLLTTAAALQFLGAEYQFRTTVYRRGGISEEGFLDGDIIIRGGGDPNISGRFYGGRITAVPERWAAALNDAGIREVGGDIIADDTWFDRKYIHPDWPVNQLSNWYCAPVSALSFNDNCIELHLSPQGKNAVKVIKAPDTDYVTVHNSCRITRSKKSATVTIRRKPGTNKIYITGKIYRKNLPATRFVTVDNPPLFLASVFKEILERSGIRVHGRARRISEEDEDAAAPLYELASTVSTMAQSVRVANTRSQNFYAEQILKTLGKEIRGEGSFAAGREVLQEFLLGLGYTPDRYRLADGSGLSRNDRLSPRLITDILLHMYRHRDGDVFYSSLAVSGKTGTLRHRLRKEPYRERIRAKTGYIHKASALSGYVETLNGRTLVFSILVNGFNTSNAKIKKIQDSICRVLVDN